METLSLASEFIYLPSGQLLRKDQFSTMGRSALRCRGSRTFKSLLNLCDNRGWSQTKSDFVYYGPTLSDWDVRDVLRYIPTDTPVELICTIYFCVGEDTLPVNSLHLAASCRVGEHLGFDWKMPPPNDEPFLVDRAEFSLHRPAFTYLMELPFLLCMQLNAHFHNHFFFLPSSPGIPSLRCLVTRRIRKNHRHAPVKVGQYMNVIPNELLTPLFIVPFNKKRTSVVFK